MVPAGGLSSGVFHFQPSELAKLAMIIYTADFLDRKQQIIKSFRQGFLPPLLVMGVLCALTVKQPDLGTTVEIAVVTLTMLFLGGAQAVAFGAYFLFRGAFGGLFDRQRTLPHGAYHCFFGSLAGQPGHRFSIDPVTDRFGFRRDFRGGAWAQPAKTFLSAGGAYGFYPFDHR